jgi:tripeptide aminopeptidase
MYTVNNDRLKETFIDLVKIPSPSWKEAGVIRYISGALAELGISCEMYPCGESHNLLARVPGSCSGKPVLLSCHMDTVVPCENVKPVVKKNRITSDGTTVLGGDDKAAIAAFIEALRVLKETNTPHVPIELLFSCAEELGLYGIKGFDMSILRSRRAFVFDSGGDIGTVITKAPYQISLEVSIRGKAAHAGMEPEKGISAIRVLALILAAIPHGRIDRETTVNAGIITGGKATNIVAEESWCKLEARSIDRAKLAAVEKRIRDIAAAIALSHNAGLRIKRRLEYPGFTMQENSPVMVMAESAVRKIGTVPKMEASGGGSDTNILNRAGIRAVNLSIGMRNVHSTKEYILVSDLIKGARLVLALIDAAGG